MVPVLFTPRPEDRRLGFPTRFDFHCNARILSADERAGTAVRVQGSLQCDMIARGNLDPVWSLASPTEQSGISSRKSQFIHQPTRHDGRSHPQAGWPNRWSALAIMGLAVLVLVVHGPLLNSYFVGDDAHHIYMGTILDNWLAIFYDQDVAVEVTGYFYRPISYLSLWLDERLFGFDPLAYHIHSLVLLAITGLLLAKLVHRLAHDAWLALLAGGLFVLSPVATSTSAWIAAAYEDVQGGVLYLGCLLAFVVYRQEGKRWHYAAALGMGFAATFSKETMATLPLTLLAVDRLAGTANFSRRGSVPAVLPFFALLGCFLALRTYMLGGIGGYPYLPTTMFSAMRAFLHLPHVLAGEIPKVLPVAPHWTAAAVVFLAASALAARPKRTMILAALTLLLLLPSLPILGTCLSGPRHMFVAAMPVAIMLGDGIHGVLASAFRPIRLGGAVVSLVVASLFVANSSALARAHATQAASERVVTSTAWATLCSIPDSKKVFFVFDGTPEALAGALRLMSRERDVAPFSVLRTAGYAVSWGLFERLSAGEDLRVYRYLPSTSAWSDCTEATPEFIRANLSARVEPGPALAASADGLRLSLHWEPRQKFTKVHFYIGKGDRGVYSDDLTYLEKTDITVLRSRGTYEVAVAYHTGQLAESKLGLATVLIRGADNGRPIRIPDQFM